MVSAAGGLGSLAAGYKTVERVAADIAAVRTATGRPFGVNLFVPDPAPLDLAAVRRYRDSLAPEATRYGVPLGEPQVDDDGWAAKLDLLVAERVPFVSVTFGCPAPAEIARLRAAGTLVMVTVTSVPEARTAAGAGADLLCVQGIEAGGHRGTFADAPGDTGLLRRSPWSGPRSTCRSSPPADHDLGRGGGGAGGRRGRGPVRDGVPGRGRGGYGAGPPAGARRPFVDDGAARAFTGRWARGS